MEASAMRHLLLVLVIGQQAYAKDLVGTRVITRFGTVLKVGNAVVDDAKRSHNVSVAGRDRNLFRVYRVQQVHGSWLWLVAENENVEGWAKVENVIPYERAIDTITSEIRAKPSSQHYNNRGNLWFAKKESTSRSATSPRRSGSIRTMRRHTSIGVSSGWS